MASGFIALPDGRMFAGRWEAHDYVVNCLAEALADSPTGQPLQKWLLEQLPESDSFLNELGFGWIKPDSSEAGGHTVVRWIDVRQLTPGNQRLFCEAAKKAATVHHPEKYLREWVGRLAEMVRQMERGEGPMALTQAPDIVPEEEGRIGPGWDDLPDTD